MEYRLLLDEPWTFLNARGNPIEGRRLTFELEDGTVLPLDVTKAEYRKPKVIKEKLQSAIDARIAVLAI